MREERVDVAIVGGGLAGLAAAAYLGRAGRRVVVLEKAAAPGGRARTRTLDGFAFNVGPHALYRAGSGRAVLLELGVPVEGGRPATGGYALHGDAAYALPATPASILTSGLLNLAGRIELGRWLARLPGLDAGALAELSLRDWLLQSVRREPVREVIEAYARLTTYAREPDRISAGAVVRQIQLGLRGVLYLHGGWQALVDGLRAAAEAAGARLHTGCRAVHVDPASLRVEEAGGRSWTASAVVLAVPPRAAAEILGDEDLRRRARQAVPSRVASLDVGLSRLPRPEARFALGIDRPLYFSVHSAVARLAPEPDGALVHAARYLGATAAPDPQAVERELEGVLDRLQPGWRQAVVHRRFAPDLVASSALPLAAAGGLPGRPGCVLPRHPRIALAGDWVGPEGLLADASLASARAAARALRGGASDANALPREVAALSGV